MQEIEKDESDQDAELHEAMIEELVERQPAIALIRQLVAGATRAPWFARLGDVLSREDQDAARAYLETLGFGHVAPARVSSWEDAEAAASSNDWDSDGWVAEESLRAALTAAALETLSEEEFEVVQGYVTTAATPQIKAAADEVARLSDLDDAGVLNAAVGAGVQAVHGAMLVMLAGEEGHPFTYRYRMFAQGRWPMGVAGMTLNIF